MSVNVKPVGRILIIDDEEPIRRSLALLLETEGYETVCAGTLGAGREALRKTSPDALLLDVWLPDGSGLEFLEGLRKADPALPILMISGRADVATAVQALHAGAVDFLEKPLAAERVLVAVRNARRLQTLEVENRELREATGLAGTFIADTRSMARVLEEVGRAAKSDATVLLLGESGTGKERLAQFLHDQSSRRAGPFVAVNTTAIPRDLTESELFGHERGAFTGAVSRTPGRFQAADGGTLFLDEIGDMPQDVQAKLLRVLETGRVEPVGSPSPVAVNVRVVCATHRPLARDVESGRFRLDLYHRLAVVVIEIPPLRERPEDVRALAIHFLDVLSRLHGLPTPRLEPDAEAALVSYPWPGNVRELRNLMERVLILNPGAPVGAPAIGRFLATNPSSPRGGRGWEEGSPAPRAGSAAGGTYKEQFDAWEKEILRMTLALEGWNVAQASARLAMDRSHLHRKIRKHGLERP
jgi:two-component system nitrogen regulation response regulator NtrX